MSLIEIEFKTDDPKMRKLCQLYWETDEEGNFVHKIKDFAKEFGLKPGQVFKRVNQYCRAFRTDQVCSECGIPFVYLDNRTNLKFYGQLPDVCDKCREKQQKRYCRKNMPKWRRHLKMVVTKH